MNDILNQLTRIETEMASLGREYIRLLCVEKHCGVFDENAAADYLRTLEDITYVEQTMTSLARHVLIHNPQSWLLIDDVRSLNVTAIARTPKIAKTLLSVENWDGVIFDHDLGAEENGFDLLKWAFENNLLPKQVRLITDNDNGRRNMEDFLKENNYQTTDGELFSDFS